VIDQFGAELVHANGAEIKLPVVVRRSDWSSETKVFEYEIESEAYLPYWQTRTLSLPCEDPASPTPEVPIPPPTSVPPTPAGAGTFSVSFSSDATSGSVAPIPEGVCAVSIYSQSESLLAGGSGLSGDKPFEWGIDVGSYSGPASFSSDQISGALRANDGSGYAWSGALPGSSVIINGDEMSGSFDITMNPITNSPTPGGTLHLTGTFSNCPVSSYDLL